MCIRDSGKAAFASLRGTYDRDGSGFKGDAAGSDKSIGFRLPYDPDSRTVYVFEACPPSIIISGNARSASCQSFSVIIAIPRNNDRHIPPRSFISPI